MALLEGLVSNLTAISGLNAMAATKITYLQYLADLEYPNRDKSKDSWTNDPGTTWLRLALYDAANTLLSHTSTCLVLPA